MQGCQLSPLLFLFYIDKLTEYLCDVEGSHPPAFGAHEIPLLMYADDVAILSTSVGGLQKLLNKLEAFCEDWDMEVNIQKSKVMVFKNGTARKRGEKCFLKGEKLEIVNTFKYLGITFSFNNLWRQHLDYASMKATRATLPVLRFLSKTRGQGDPKLGLHFVVFTTHPCPRPQPCSCKGVPGRPRSQQRAPLAGARGAGRRVDERMC
jgi:hypothetical protein